MNFSQSYSDSPTFLFESGLISATTTFAEFDIDYDEELRQKREEVLEIRKLQNEIASVKNPPNMLFGLEDTEPYYPKKEGGFPRNIEYIEGICDQTHKYCVGDVFDYNDVISYFE